MNTPPRPQPQPPGPLTGIKVLELAGVAPAPFAGMLFSDYGASVLRIDRPTSTSTTPSPSQSQPPSPDILARNKASIPINLKTPSGRAILLRMLPAADVLIDPFRPGVLEDKLGLDPETVLRRRNPRLVVARLVGFRREGKYAEMAGHDVNYLAVSGVLSMIGAPVRVEGEGREESMGRGKPGSEAGPPIAPGNILGDFAGGGLMCVVGVLMALVERARSGVGQVVEVNMVDGAAYLATAMRLGRKVEGQWDRPRGMNLADGGCPYYGVYECRDRGRYMTVAALELKFFEAMCRGLGMKSEDWGGGDREDRENWPVMRRRMQQIFRSKLRQEWEEIFQGTDACCLPVLEQGELEDQGYQQKAAVGLSRTPSRDVSEHGWDPRILDKGTGAEEMLEKWLGWKQGKQYHIEDGVFTAGTEAKL